MLCSVGWMTQHRELIYTTRLLTGCYGKCDPQYITCHGLGMELQPELVVA
jgi:hypothetical protein